MRATALLLLGSAVVLLGPAIAAAQDAPLTAVLSSSVSDDSLRSTGGAIERVIRARIEPLGVVRVAGTPALGLADLQLAVGCMGETNECLTAVAGQLEVDALLLPSVDRAGEEFVVSVTFFDKRNGGRTTRAVRRAEQESELLESVDGLLRELFGLPPAPVGPETGGGGGGEEPRPVDGGGGISIPGLIVAGVGVAALGTGVVFGLMAQSSEDDYAGAPVGTDTEIDAAIEIRDRAESQALLANIMFAAGGALVIGGAVLILLGGDDDEGGSTERAWIAPSISPAGTSLTVGGTFGERW